MMIISGLRRAISRGEQAFEPDMQHKLKTALIMEMAGYYKGLPCPKCWPRHRRLAVELCPSSEWLATALVNRSWPMVEAEFREAVRASKRPLCVVAGADQNWEFMDPDYIRPMPTRNAWHHLDDAGPKLEDDLPKDSTVLFSCGPVSRVMIYQLRQFRLDLALVDVGSAFDHITKGRLLSFHTGKLNPCKVCN